MIRQEQYWSNQLKAIYDLSKEVIYGLLLGDIMN